LALATAGCWPVPGQNPDRTSYNGFEEAITDETVGDLVEVWRAQGWLDAPPLATVTSPGGAHSVSSCTVWTADPATGALRWEEATDINLCAFGGPGPFDFGEPYVVDTDDGPVVAAGMGVTYVRPPGVEEGQWGTYLFGAADGSYRGTLDVGVAAAVRGDVVAGLADIPAAPGRTAVRLALAQVGGTGRLATWTVGSEAPYGGLTPGGVTLGAQQVVHAGRGAVRADGGGLVAGNGLRAYDRAAPPAYCGDVDGVTVSCPAWTLPTDGVPTTPVVGGGRIFTRTDAGTLYAAHAGTGELLWSATGLGDAGSPAFAADGGLWVPTGDGRVAIFDASGCGTATCAPLTSFDTGSGAAVSTPAVTDDVVVVSTGGELVALPQDGCGSPTCGPLWTAPGEGTPIVSNGRIYARQGVEVVAYGLPR
jgi:outer membrane protein assembly factor BamB